MVGDIFRKVFHTGRASRVDRTSGVFLPAAAAARGKKSSARGGGKPRGWR
jgi:hypothetical protein